MAGVLPASSPEPTHTSTRKGWLGAPEGAVPEATASSPIGRGRGRQKHPKGCGVSMRRAGAQEFSSYGYYSRSLWNLRDKKVDIGLFMIDKSLGGERRGLSPTVRCLPAKPLQGHPCTSGASCTTSAQRGPRGGWHPPHHAAAARRVPPHAGATYACGRSSRSLLQSDLHSHLPFDLKMKSLLTCSLRFA